jgi:hypothetical protein
VVLTPKIKQELGNTVELEVIQHCAPVANHSFSYSNALCCLLCSIMSLSKTLPLMQSAHQKNVDKFPTEMFSSPHHSLELNSNTNIRDMIKPS